MIIFELWTLIFNRFVFLNADPLAASGGQERLSPFHAMGNNPVSLVDPNGLWGYEFQVANGAGIPEAWAGFYEVIGRALATDWSRSNPHSGSFWGYGGGGESAEINSIYYENNEITFFTNIVAKFGYIDSRYGIVGSFLASADGENDGAIMKSMEEYDYSIAEIQGKKEEDLNYIINGIGGNYLTRWYKTVKRDWNGSSTDQKIDFGITVATAPIGGVGWRITKAAAKTGKSFFEGTKYTNKVLGQMKKGDFHGFPEGVKAFESSGVITTIKREDGVTRQMLKIPGEYGGKKGFFEFIKEADGTINHRLFRPNP